MKTIILLLSVFLTVNLSGQKVILINNSKNDCEVKVIKEGTLIHHHIMKPKDRLTVENVGWYGTKFSVKQLGCQCIESYEFKYKRSRKLNSEGFYEYFIDNFEFQREGISGGYLKIISPLCSDLKKA